MTEKQAEAAPSDGEPLPGPRFLQADGYRWTIREVDAPNFDRTARRHLIFDGEIIMRRVRFFPVGWSNLSDEALYALSWVTRSDQKS